MVSLLVARAIARSRRLSPTPWPVGVGGARGGDPGSSRSLPPWSGTGDPRRAPQKKTKSLVASCGGGRRGKTVGDAAEVPFFKAVAFFFYLFRTRRVQGNENSRRSAPERDDRKKAKKRLLCAVDHSARASMKSAASCVN